MMRAWQKWFFGVAFLLGIGGMYWGLSLYPWLRKLRGEWHTEVLTVSSDRLGRIVEGAFTEGMKVQAGTILFRYEGEAWKAKEEQGILALNTAQERIDLERSELDQAMDGYIYARSRLEQGVATPEEVDQRLAALQEAQGRCDRAMADWAIAQANLVAIRSELKQLQVMAPCSGTIIGVSKRVGEVAQAGDPVLRLAQEEASWVTALIPEDLLAQVHVGQEAQISFPASDRTWRGRVIQMGMEMEGGFLPVRIALEGETAELKPGMRAEVAIRVR